jgi:hypothetical protein
LLFDVHVLELARLEDFAAFLAFDEFGIFVAADNLYAEVLAGLRLACVLRGRGRLGGHKSGSATPKNRQERQIRGKFSNFPVF